MNYTISQENLQKVADYLVTKPWAEVNPLIQLLATAKPVQPQALATAPAATSAPAITAPTLQTVPDVAQ
jgi:hypothetical protein